MKSLRKKLLITAVAICLVTSSFAGCGQKDNQDDKKAANGTTTQTARTTEKSKPTLRYLGPNLPVDPNKRYEAQIIEEVTGYKVNYEMLPQDKSDEKLNIIIASGEEYDVITTYGNFTDMCIGFAQKGAIADLDSILDQYAPRVKEVISQKSLDLFKVDNKTYFIPSKIALEYINMGLLIRQDWLDKLNLQQPKTLDEFVAVLKAFKEKDPGKNGDKNIPLLISGPDQVHGLMGAFGIANGWNVVDGKLVAREELPGFKEYLEFMAALYKEGLIDKEFPINKDTSITEKFSSGRAGVISQNTFGLGALADALQKNIPDAKYSYIEPIIGENGQQGVTQTAGYDFLTFIPKASKNAEAALKWINLKLEKDNFKKTTIGDEGIHHVIKDGAYAAILPKFNDDYGSGWFYLTGVDEEAYSKYWIARVQRDARNYEGFAKLQQGIDKYNKLDVVRLATNVPTFKKNSASLATLTSDYMIKVIAGTEPLSSYDDFLKKWKAAGGDESTKEINEWYARYQQVSK